MWIYLYSWDSKNVKLVYIGMFVLQDAEMVEPTPQKAITKTVPTQKRSIQHTKEVVSIRNHTIVIEKLTA